MGNKCCGANADYGDVSLEAGLGTEGVSEDYQYHETDIKKNKLHLSEFDKFYRLTSGPLYYLNVVHYFNKLDEMITSDQGFYVMSHIQYVSLETFRQHFQD